MRSLYIHVPFCFHKCHYCDFYSIVDTRVRQREFLDRLVRELRAFSPWVVGEPLETIFVGGGTPSLLAVELWQKFLIELDRLFDLSRVRSGAGEFTVECNPETVTPELLAVLASGGVGRVSVGAQSFDPRHLKTLERWHDPQNVERAIDLARQAGIGRQSIDLIYGIPGQSVEDWQRDLERAIGLGTEHVSCYCLTYEPNTAMTRRMQRGEFEPAPDETEAAMFRLTAEMLGRAGLTRYEISNYARQGAHCAHNMNYWRNGNWLAAGPSASAHVHGYRWKNVQRLGDWLEQSDDGFATVTDLEKPDRARSLCERMMLGIRLDEGLSAAEMLEAASAIDLHAPARLLAEVEAYAAVGDLETTGGVWRLSEEGQLRADAVASDLMAAISTQQV
ncbi:MAG: radical SAM family heme chaperone HemW [Phycisphaeraceae bacterium]|nr:radical SAM family heme chaperone HemW [Phycisphaeraceae bacterium]